MRPMRKAQEEITTAPPLQAPKETDKAYDLTREIQKLIYKTLTFYFNLIWAQKILFSVQFWSLCIYINQFNM